MSHRKHPQPHSHSQPHSIPQPQPPRAHASALVTACALALVFSAFVALGYLLAGAPAWLFRPVVYGVVFVATLYCLLVVTAHTLEAGAPSAEAGAAHPSHHPSHSWRAPLKEWEREAAARRSSIWVRPYFAPARARSNTAPRRAQ